MRAAAKIYSMIDRQAAAHTAHQSFKGICLTGDFSRLDLYSASRLFDFSSGPGEISDVCMGFIFCRQRQIRFMMELALASTASTALSVVVGAGMRQLFGSSNVGDRCGMQRE